jgi:hypothetical protein
LTDFIFKTLSRYLTWVMILQWEWKMPSLFIALVVSNNSDAPQQFSFIKNVSCLFFLCLCFFYYFCLSYLSNGHNITI